MIATAGASSRARVRDRGALEVVEYRDEDWPEAVLRLTGGQGVNAAVNLVRNGAVDALRSVTDGGHLATITSDPPPPERGIAISTVYVRPDGRQLAALVGCSAPAVSHCLLARPTRYRRLRPPFRQQLAEPRAALL